MMSFITALPGNIWHFLLDVKIGLDLGRTWHKALQVARIMYGVR